MINNKKILLWTFGVILTIVIAVILLLFSMSRSYFELINHTKLSIAEINVFWRDKSMKVGGIDSRGRRKIYINDEAAAKFVVKFQDSKVIESKEIYFSGPTYTKVDIYEDQIKLRYK